MSVYIVSETSFWVISALAFVGFAILLVALWFFAVRSRHAIVYYNPTSRNESLVAACATMKVYDRVPLWGFNGHIQSIYASQVRKGPTYPLRRCALAPSRYHLIDHLDILLTTTNRELLDNRHGGHFAIDWLQTHSSPKGLIWCVSSLNAP
jgi:hypothetical protein